MISDPSKNVIFLGLNFPPFYPSPGTIKGNASKKGKGLKGKGAQKGKGKDLYNKDSIGCRILQKIMLFFFPDSYNQDFITKN